MLTRRLLTASLLAAAAAPARAQGDFGAFLAGVRADAIRAGVSPRTAERALAGVHPNAHVLELDQHQPESQLTWAQFRAKIVTDKRVAEGRDQARANAAVLRAVEDRYGVARSVMLGIWGLESNFGATGGNYSVVEALATLAYDGRRSSFFRAELIAALKILDAGDISPERMVGSYAGAMGQPQFMPSSYLRLAVDFDGDGRRDIWGSKADSLASIANYLEKSGWRRGETWGEEVRVPGNFDPSGAGRERMRALADWSRAGVRRVDGSPLRGDGQAGLLMPDGAGGDAFVVYPNFSAVRKYNASDYYVLSVGLIGDRVTA
jgi:membrane-bound lytic murein transglycosylase B